MKRKFITLTQQQKKKRNLAHGPPLLDLCADDHAVQPRKSRTSFIVCYCKYVTSSYFIIIYIIYSCDKRIS